MNLNKSLNCWTALFFASFLFQLKAAEPIPPINLVESTAIKQKTRISSQPKLSELLGGMGAALNSGNYQLSLVYIHDGQIDSLKLSHLTSEKNQYDMLEHLQGIRRLVITHNGETWLYMGQEKIHISSEEESPVIRWRHQLQRLGRNIAQYKVFISGINRVAGRLAYQINFISKDKQRHSSRLWIDVNNFLPMRLDSLNAEGKVIEQLLTVHLNYPANLTADDFQPGANFKLNPLASTVSEFEQNTPQSLWKIHWLPVGFELSSSKIRTEKGVDYEQKIYSDGLSTLSIFIESVKSSNKFKKQSFLRGDAIIFDTVILDKRITVIGNIPIKTAEKIALSVSLQVPVKVPLKKPMEAANGASEKIEL